VNNIDQTHLKGVEKYLLIDTNKGDVMSPTEACKEAFGEALKSSTMVIYFTRGQDSVKSELSEICEGLQNVVFVENAKYSAKGLQTYCARVLKGRLFKAKDVAAYSNLLDETDCRKIARATEEEKIAKSILEQGINPKDFYAVCNIENFRRVIKSVEEGDKRVTDLLREAEEANTYTEDLALEAMDYESFEFVYDGYLNTISQLQEQRVKYGLARLIVRHILRFKPKLGVEFSVKPSELTDAKHQMNEWPLDNIFEEGFSLREFDKAIDLLSGFEHDLIRENETMLLEKRNKEILNELHSQIEKIEELQRENLELKKKKSCALCRKLSSEKRELEKKIASLEEESEYYRGELNTTNEAYLEQQNSVEEMLNSVESKLSEIDNLKQENRKLKENKNSEIKYWELALKEEGNKVEKLEEKLKIVEGQKQKTKFLEETVKRLEGNLENLSKEIACKDKEIFSLKQASRVTTCINNNVNNGNSLPSIPSMNPSTNINTIINGTNFDNFNSAIRMPNLSLYRDLESQKHDKSYMNHARGQARVAAYCAVKGIEGPRLNYTSGGVPNQLVWVASITIGSSPKKAVTYGTATSKKSAADEAWIALSDRLETLTY
jgi:hypothetical protein